MKVATGARIATIAIGLWLMAAPAVLGYGPLAADVDRILGPIAGGVAFVAIWPFVRMLRWVTIPPGVLLLLAPLLGYPAEATVNSLGCGLAIVALAFVAGPIEASFGGGWRVVRDGRVRRPAQG